MSASTRPPLAPDEDPEETARPDRMERARRALVNRLGETPAPVSTAWACGSVGVQASHTHYSEGFALLLPVPQGVAVALRPAERPQVLDVASGQTWRPDAASLPPWGRTAVAILEMFSPSIDLALAVVNDVLPGCRDGFLAGLAVALVRGLRRLDVTSSAELGGIEDVRDTLVPRLAERIAAATEQPYSEAYLLASFAGPSPPFTLVDTATREHLPVSTEARTALEWAVVDLRGNAPRPAAFHRHRHDQANTALKQLRQAEFGGLSTFRDLEHRDLDRATRTVDASLAPVVRHLTSENRRVQKHVAALRREDWQMVGALLLMSHASLRDHWDGAHAPAETLIGEVEACTNTGLYGACMTERGGAVLVVGRPSRFEGELQRSIEAFEAAHGRAPHVLRL